MAEYSRRRFLRAVPVAGAALAAGCSGVLDGRGRAAGPLPPGTDGSGVTDPAALYEAHRSGLADRSYAYKQTFDPGLELNTVGITGRQQDGADGRRFVRRRHARVVEDEPPAYVAEHRVTVDGWHGRDMPEDLEYRRTLTEVDVNDEGAYAERSAHAEEFPPGETTEYERWTGNSLVSAQDTYLRGLVLEPVEFRLADTADVDGEAHARFEVAAVEQAFRLAGDVLASGSLLVRSDGVVRRSSLTVEERWGSEAAHAASTITDLGSATVRSPPPWVAREFADG